MKEDRVSRALAEETKRFEQWYRWLEKAMSATFFDEVPPDFISLIVHSLVGFKVQNHFSQIHLPHAAIALTLERPIADVDILRGFSHVGIKNYTTFVSTLPLPDEKERLHIAILYFTSGVESPSGIDQRFLQTLTDEQQKTALALFERARTRDHCQYDVSYEKEWRKKGCSSVFLILAWKNTPKHNFLYRLSRVVYRHGLVMKRVSAAYADPYSVHNILTLCLELHGAEGQAAEESDDIDDFLQEVVTLKYFGSRDLIDQTFVKRRLIRGNLANFLRAATNFIHQLLVHADPHLYTLDNIEEALERHSELTVMLCEAFECRFNPKKIDLKRYEMLKEEYYRLVKKLDTGYEVLDTRRKNVLLQGMNFVSHILRTNFFRKNKTALAFRMESTYLDFVPFDRTKIFPELPYAVFFFKGMHYLAFHVRFRDLARGGLRTVCPEREERVIAERGNVFLECYNLAYTQHKKNKDIPEGGAKGVIFLKPNMRLENEAKILEGELERAGLSIQEQQKCIARFMQEQRLEYLYETQRSFIRNFLSLINSDEKGVLRSKDIVDYLNCPEYIYLGPDENMHDSMIEWIAYESQKEGYKCGAAFITGKPLSGINHKQYGVTSFGLNVYVEQALFVLGIDPTQTPFTVKMTGGPDGDVAGNEIYNLYRFYPKTARLIALTDVSGTIFDPQGLSLEALVELFRTGKSICFYPPSLLSRGGFLLDRTERREVTPLTFQTPLYRSEGEGKVHVEYLSGSEMNALFRSNVHEKKVDIFIPCGGRPRTLFEGNVAEFLDDEGKPTARAIVEGANLYLTQGARLLLEEKGALVIKDSSANKGGVIASSFEVLCGLVLTEEEFISQKETLVAEILERIAACSLDEAKLLLKTHYETHAPLSLISDQISERIHAFKDELLAHLAPLPLLPTDPYTRCFLTYILNTLRTHTQGLLSIPDSHKKAIIATHIASRLVYTRGLTWAPSLLDTLPLILQDETIIGPPTKG